MEKAIKDCRTRKELYDAVCLYFNRRNIDDKWSRLLKKRLREETAFTSSLQLCYDYILNSEHPMKKEKLAVVRPKGTCWQGMECHSSRS